MQTNLNNNVVWSQPACAACEQAKTLLKSKGIPFEVKVLGENATKEEMFALLPRARSVPQIFLSGKHIGGLPELKKYFQ